MATMSSRLSWVVMVSALALAVQRRDRDPAQQAQFGGQRVDVALRHRQFDLVAAPALAGLRFGLGLHEGRRRGRGAAGTSVLRQLLQHHAHVGDGVLVDMGAVAVAVELHLEDVLGGQEGVHVFGRERHLALADAVEQRLEDVGHLAHVVQAEGRGAALDRMRGAEDRVQVFGVGRGDVDGQQQPFFFGQQFFGFIEEDLEKLADVDGHDETPSQFACFHCLVIAFSRSLS
jgi:hypothetical protein